jgi:hypothetical protein
MSVSVSAGSGTPDIVNLLMMKKAMSANQTQTAQLLEGMTKATPPAQGAAHAGRTWYA